MTRYTPDDPTSSSVFMNISSSGGNVRQLPVNARRFATFVLLLAYVGCKGDTAPAVATTLAANSSITFTAVAGTPVTPAPSVVVKDQNGNPMSGVVVTFTVTSGGGTASGSPATTDATGVATLASWTLGTAAGANVLTATTGTLTAVTFTATGTAGVAATIVKSAGDNQIASVGTAVPIPPAVLVKDANGNPKSDVAVTFSVTAGGGSVTGGTTTTNAAGIATVGSWVLGPSAGINTLNASVAGLPTVIFSANGVSPLCAVRTSHIFGATTAGTLALNDCQFSDGSFVDFFSTTLAQGGAYFFRETASTFDAYLLLGTPDGSTIAENDDGPDSTTNSAIKAILPPGTYLLGATSYLPQTTGDYSISSSVAPNNVTNCELVFIVKNVSTAQNIETTDCLWTQPPAAPLYADGYFIFLKAGDTVTITMSSSVVDSYLELVRQNGVRVAFNDNKDATTKDAQITYTVAATDYYAIFARTSLSLQVGAYTLTIQ